VYVNNLGENDPLEAMKTIIWYKNCNPGLIEFVNEKRKKKGFRSDLSGIISISLACWNRNQWFQRTKYEHWRDILSNFLQLPYCNWHLLLWSIWKSVKDICTVPIRFRLLVLDLILNKVYIQMMDENLGMISVLLCYFFITLVFYS
jgi:hypothetical protein